jgi:hypothetical protein
MPSESLHDTTPHDADAPNHLGEASDVDAEEKIELPVDLSEFTQRLASFGLGEAPDPLLTESRPPSKRRRRS